MHLLLLLFALYLSPLALSLTLDQADSYHAAADVTYIIDSHNYHSARSPAAMANP